MRNHLFVELNVEKYFARRGCIWWYRGRSGTEANTFVHTYAHPYTCQLLLHFDPFVADSGCSVARTFIAMANNVGKDVIPHERPPSNKR